MGWFILTIKFLCLFLIADFIVKNIIKKITKHPLDLGGLGFVIFCVLLFIQLQWNIL